MKYPPGTRVTNGYGVRGTIIDYDEWKIGREKEIGYVTIIEEETINAGNNLPIKLDIPNSSGRKITYWIGSANLWNPTGAKEFVEDHCNHDFQPFFNSISCVKCGIDQRDV